MRKYKDFLNYTNNKSLKNEVPFTFNTQGPISPASSPSFAPVKA